MDHAGLKGSLPAVQPEATDVMVATYQTRKAPSTMIFL